MAFKLKRDDKNVPVVNDKDLPVFINDEDNSEVAFDPDDARKTTAQLRAEAAQSRTKLNETTTTLKKFEGIDPALYAENAAIVEKIKDKKLIESGEADKLRSDVTKQYEDQLKTERDKNTSILNNWNDEKITNAFLGSKFVNEKVAVPADMLKASFGNRFKVEDGVIRAYNPDGTPVMSKAKIGDFAGVEEAIEIFVTSHPQASALLKSGQRSGGGSPGGGGGGGGGGNPKEMKRSEFNKLDAAKKSEFSKGGGKVIPDA